jgi:hypothetical protein
MEKTIFDHECPFVARAEVDLAIIEAIIIAMDK